MVSAKLYVRVAQLVTAGTGVLMVDGSYSGGGIRVELSRCLSASYEHGFGLLVLQSSLKLNKLGIGQMRVYSECIQGTRPGVVMKWASFNQMHPRSFRSHLNVTRSVLFMPDAWGIDEPAHSPVHLQLDGVVSIMYYSLY